MAKVKVKFDLAAIKKWLLEHGEKLAFGGAILVFLIFTWSAVSREVLEPSKQPQQLQQKAADVGAHVTRSPWEEKTAGIQIIAYDERAKRDRIAPEVFKWRPLNQSLANPKTKRDSPLLLPIEELKVASGFGAFALKFDAVAGQGGKPGSGGSTKLKGLPWVAIAGLVPFQKQAREYARVFDRAMGGSPEKDTPTYAGFKIQRAEINDEDPGKLDWKPLARSPLVKEFEPGPAEVVHPEYVDSELTQPLAPLQGAAWGAAVTHPKIPLSAQANAQSPPPQPAAGDDVKDADTKEADNDFHRNRAKKDPTANPATNAVNPDDTQRGYRLFRAFDFTVEPNKKYRYRVVLGLENPNFGLSRQYLKDPETANQEFLATNPTEPSGVISVPDGFQVLAGGVKAPRLGEPSVKLMLIATDEETGRELSYEHDVWRGTVANTIAKVVVLRDLHNPQLTEEMTDVKFKTDMVVLDIRGGRIVSGKNGSKLTAPGEVLFLDRNGDLIVRSESDDQSMYAKRVPPEETNARAKPDPIDSNPKPFKPPYKKPKK
ncbi:MAG: hypothetical protein HY288_07245 [Planctomycetia bacterium]|nr:hypothetical protein [Planctomycetia bacterium]